MERKICCKHSWHMYLFIAVPKGNFFGFENPSGGGPTRYCQTYSYHEQ